MLKNLNSIKELVQHIVRIWLNPVRKKKEWCLLLSEDILCKESTVTLKKFDFKIFTYLYISRFPEFIYAIFMVMYACMYVCMCACEWTR